MSSIAIVGVGAIGGVIGANLVRAGQHRVTFCVRQPAGALRITGVDEIAAGQIKEVVDPAQVPAADWVLVATKAHQTSGVVGWLRRLVGPRTRIAVLQNGVEHRERIVSLLPHMPASEVVPVVVDFPAQLIDRGEIRQHAKAILTFADDPAGVAFAGLFAGTAIEARTTADFLSASWRKLCINVASGAVPALTGQGLHVLRRPDMGKFGLALMEEACAVGRRLGASLPSQLPADSLRMMRQTPAGAGSSMLWDRLAGRALEFDARNGAVVRAGRRVNIATPYNCAAVALLTAISAGAS